MKDSLDRTVILQSATKMLNNLIEEAENATKVLEHIHKREVSSLEVETIIACSMFLAYMQARNMQHLEFEQENLGRLTAETADDEPSIVQKVSIN